MDPFMQRYLLTATLLLLGASTAQAGLYYSGEQYASLPTQWRGFLLDHRLLRNLALKPKAESEAGPMRQTYRQQAEKLQARADRDQLDAAASADLGALYVRLGEPGRAV